MKNNQKLELAIKAHKEKKYLIAEGIYEEILKDDTNNYEVNFFLGTVKAHLNKFSEAKSFFEKAIKLNDELSQPYLNLANCFKEMKNYNQAELTYLKALKVDSNNEKAYYNLSLIWHDQKKYNKAENGYKNAIRLKNDFYQAYHNLGIVYNEQEKLHDAENCLKKAIQINPKFYQAHMNLGSVLKKLKKFNEAEESFRTAIKINPNYDKAYNNLGNVMIDSAKLDEAEKCFKKAITLNSNFLEPKNNLKFVMKHKILNKKINILNNKKIPTISSNPFITERKIDQNLINNLYQINTIELDKTIKNDARYGNGKCSVDFHLFEDNDSVLKNVLEDLKIIMSDAVKSEVFVFDSFFNILKAGGGTTPHKHINQYDEATGFVNQKYSLTYYVSVGDQNCTEPGYLKLYEPDQKILPSDGTIVIIPASRSHSAIYNGGKDRIMIGVNFYSF